MLKKIFLILLLFFMSVPSYCEWDKDIPLTSDNLTDYPTDNQSNLDALELLLTAYPKGMTLSYSSASTIVVSAGGVVCSNSGGTVRKLRGNTSTINVTFSDLDTSSEASSTTYYIYANCDAVATTATFKISINATSPTGVTSYKRLGSFYNNSSSNIDSHTIVNDELPNVVIVSDSVVNLNNNTNLRGNTISNGSLGRTTTGSSASFNSGTTIDIPSGCYVTGGYKQTDGNFIRWDYACP